MATSVTHAGQHRGTGTLVTWLVVALLGCAGPPGPPPGPTTRSLGAPPGSLSLVATGDWVTYHAALARGVDPTPVAAIAALKQALSE